MERYYSPASEKNQPLQATWRDPQTLELQFRHALLPPTEVDPRRFALLRYNISFDRGNAYYCYFDLCYRELGAAEAIPESISWDAEESSVLRLHFAEPIPPSLCEAWGDPKAKYHALELLYAGIETAFGDTTDPVAEPDMLFYADETAVYELGPPDGLAWLDACLTGGSCELDELCVARGGRDERPGWSNVWVDCP